MRRSNALLAALVLMLAGSSATEAQQAGPRLGYIDSRAILEAAPGAKTAQYQFERDMARYRAEVQQMGSDLETLLTSFEQQQLTLSPEARANREEEIRMKQQSYNTRVSELEGQAASRQSELVQPVMEMINQVIDQMRQDGNYAVIFDVAGGAIIAADPTLDLTQEVIRRLTELAGAATPPGAPGG